MRMTDKQCRVWEVQYFVARNLSDPDHDIMTFGQQEMRELFEADDISCPICCPTPQVRLGDTGLAKLPGAGPCGPQEAFATVTRIHQDRLTVRLDRSWRGFSEWIIDAKDFAKG